VRTLSADQQAVIAAPGGYAAHVRVRIYDGSAWQDLTALWGHDWLDGVDYGADREEPVSQATVSLKRDIGMLSLSPLRSDSPINASGALVREGRLFVVEVATIALLASPASGDWQEVFRGEIDDVDAASEQMSFTGRDYGGARLQDTTIEVERTYGSAGGVALQTIIQSILTDNGLGAFTLQTPVSPSWSLKPWVQKKEQVAEALSVLTTLIGWEVRYRWHAPAAGFALVLQSPDRTKTAADWTIGADTYEEVGTSRTGRADVRNAWQIVYSDKADLDAKGTPKRKTVARTDATSIAAYGRRWAEIAEASSSVIDTQAEAERMADAALADTKDVLYELQLAGPLTWWLELNDLVEVPANLAQFSAVQKLAVASIQHSLSDGEGRSTITLKGKPSLGVGHWLGLETGKGDLEEPAVLAGPEAPTAPVVSPVVGGVRVAFTPPLRGIPPAEYELHLGDTSGFTPSNATVAAVSDSTVFELAHLVPGASKWAKIVPRSEDGTPGTASAAFACAAGQAQAAHLEDAVGWGRLPLNGSFETSTGGPSVPPDHWTVLFGTWGTHFAMVTSGGGVAGAQFLRVAAGAAETVQIASGFFPVEGQGNGQVTYKTSDWARRFSGTNANSRGRVYLEVFDEAFALIQRFQVMELTGTSSSGWLKYGDWRTPAVSTYRWARIMIEGQGNGSVFMFDVDGVECIRATSLAASAEDESTANASTNSTTFASLRTLNFDQKEPKSRVLALFNGAFYTNTASDGLELRLLRNGVSMGTRRFYFTSASQQHSVAFTWLFEGDLVPGAYVYTLQWRRYTGTGTISKDTNASLSLTAVEIPL
jgi:hypothetical protein